MKIQHSDLVNIYKLLMDALWRSDIKEIEFFYDYYWNVSLGARHDIYNDPVFDMGSIEHDLERIHQCIADKEAMTAHFRWLGNILIAISDTIDHQFERGESYGLLMDVDDMEL